MPFNRTDGIVVVCSLASLYALHAWRKSVQKPLPLPPGPKGLPLLGNTLDMLDPEIWESGKRWGESYGEFLIYPSFLSCPIKTVAFRSSGSRREPWNVVYLHKFLRHRGRSIRKTWLELLIEAEQRYD